jgi:DNA-binding response OmpR family regulator
MLLEQGQAKMQILCVEDNVDVREMMIALLEHAGYEVTTASTATDGLKLAGQNRFSLIILDNWLDKESGVELCKQIRDFDRHTPILFFSSADCETDVQEAIDAGAQGYLIKPRGIEDLIESAEVLTYSTSGQCGVEREKRIEASR